MKQRARNFLIIACLSISMYACDPGSYHYLRNDTQSPVKVELTTSFPAGKFYSENNEVLKYDSVILPIKRNTRFRLKNKMAITCNTSAGNQYSTTFMMPPHSTAYLGRGMGGYLYPVNSIEIDNGKKTDTISGKFKGRFTMIMEMKVWYDIE